jgi:hypothetical protein
MGIFCLAAGRGKFLDRFDGCSKFSLEFFLSCFPFCGLDLVPLYLIPNYGCSTFCTYFPIQYILHSWCSKNNTLDVQKKKKFLSYINIIWNDMFMVAAKFLGQLTENVFLVALLDWPCYNILTFHIMLLPRTSYLYSSLKDTIVVPNLQTV